WARSKPDCACATKSRDSSRRTSGSRANARSGERPISVAPRATMSTTPVWSQASASGSDRGDCSMPFVTRRSLLALTVLLAVVAFAAGLFVWSGIYNVGADDTHTRPVHAVLQALRNESIEHHSRNIEVPDLDDPALVVAGAGNYAAMCAGCHLAPGAGETELSRGLYPAP